MPLQVIAPEEIVDPNVDEHSVMTYLSQFPKSKLKPGAPLRAKTLHPKRAKAFGPGGWECSGQREAPGVLRGLGLKRVIGPQAWSRWGTWF